MGAEETTCPNEQTGREDSSVDVFVSHLSNMVQMAIMAIGILNMNTLTVLTYSTVQKFGFSSIYI